MRILGHPSFKFFLATAIIAYLLRKKLLVVCVSSGTNSMISPMSQLRTAQALPRIARLTGSSRRSFVMVLDNIIQTVFRIQLLIVLLADPNIKITILFVIWVNAAICERNLTCRQTRGEVYVQMIIFSKRKMMFS